MNREYRVVTDALGGIVQIYDDHGNPLYEQEATWLGERMSIAYPSYSSVYLMFDSLTTLYKVGVSKDVRRRRMQLGKHINTRASIVCYHFDAYEVERFIHAIFGVQGKRKHGEWFELNADDLRIFRCDNDLELFGSLKSYTKRHENEDVVWCGAWIPDLTTKLSDGELAQVAAGEARYVNPPPESKPLSMLFSRHPASLAHPAPAANAAAESE